MKAIQLTAFGLENLSTATLDTPEPGPGEVLVRMAAASVNPRDFQIVTGNFTPNVPLPLIPLSDGAGEVVAIGEAVSRAAVGDLVTPLFFPDWLSGEALSGERQRSSGLEAPGTLREYAVYPESEIARAASHLSDRLPATPAPASPRGHPWSPARALARVARCWFRAPAAWRLGCSR